MKYFILSPSSKDPLHAEASRLAMLTYASVLDRTNIAENESTAYDIREWVGQLEQEENESRPITILPSGN